MASKTIIQNKSGEDILGLVAFGSLVANIFEIASKKSMEEVHEALKAYASELKRHYNHMMVRERSVYNENFKLKKANEEFFAINSLLLKELIDAVNEMIRLKGSSTEAVLRRMRSQIRRTTGGTN